MGWSVCQKRLPTHEINNLPYTHTMGNSTKQLMPIYQLNWSKILVFKRKALGSYSFYQIYIFFKHKPLKDSVARSQESQTKGLSVKIVSRFDLDLTSVAFPRPSRRIFQWNLCQKIMNLTESLTSKFSCSLKLRSLLLVKWH